MKRLALTVLFATVGSMGIANAVVAFSSFAPGDVYNTGQGYTIGGPNASPVQRVAVQFTSLASGSIDQVRIAHFYSSGDTTLNVAMYNDNGSDQLGTWFTTWTFADSNSAGHITTLTNAFPSLTLTAGQKYWVEVFSATNGLHAWNLADASIPLGRITWSTNDGTTYNYASGATVSAFDVTVVPEPTSMIALGLGVAALAARRRRKV